MYLYRLTLPPKTRAISLVDSVPALVAKPTGAMIFVGADVMTDADAMGVIVSVNGDDARRFDATLLLLLLCGEDSPSSSVCFFFFFFC